MKKITISGTGCALADFLFTSVNFNSSGFQKFRSRIEGDGGLAPGKLVFTEELEKFSGLPYEHILEQITGKKGPEFFNIGGPGLVSMINASQLLGTENFQVKFYGSAGNDGIADKIFSMIRKTPLDISHYEKISSKATPSTDVLSDPDYDNGHGERTFINNIGAAWDYTPEMLKHDFFDADIVCFGGTALVPQIHDNLQELLSKAKSENCITVVNTVFDFRNEKRFPGKPWPLGKDEKCIEMTDLLIMDFEEALRISGTKNGQEAAEYFISKKSPAFVITNGAKNILAYSNGTFFRKMELSEFPVSEKVGLILKETPALKGDTTGCGDNFAGGMIASLGWQLQKQTNQPFLLDEAIAWGVASGGYSCFYVGGTYFEKQAGEKFSKVTTFYQSYKEQVLIKE